LTAIVGRCRRLEKFVALKGNHDAMMVEALRDPSKMAAWIEKGGDAALASYGRRIRRCAAIPHCVLDQCG